jgi:hypothetical protein
MLFIADTIKQRYPQTHYYTQDQLDRMQRARQRREQQQASVAPPPALQQYPATPRTAASTLPANNQMATNYPITANQQAAGNYPMAASYPMPANQQTPDPWQQGSSMGPVSSDPPSPFIAQQPAAQAAPQPAQRYVATVKGQGITAHTLDWAAMLIAPYLKWRKNQLNIQIQRAESKKEQERARQEVKEIEQCLVGDREDLRKCALDYLIDDALIEQAIKQMGQGQWENFSQEVKSRLGVFYQEITTGYLEASSPLRSREAETSQPVQDILAIFLWRQRFESYLATGGQSLADWIKKERQRQKGNLHIYDEQAGIKPARKGLLGR